MPVSFPRRALLVACAAAGMLATALPAAGADLPPPLVMREAPPDRGAWKMDLLEVDGRPPDGARALSSGLTVCTTAVEAMARRGGPVGERCSARYVENGAERAVTESTCPGDPPVRTRTTVTRDGAKAWLVATETTRGAGTQRARMRLTHAGECRAGDAAVTLGRDSEVCRRAEAQVAAMDPATRCTGDAAERADCLRTIEQMRARVASLCR